MANPDNIGFTQNRSGANKLACIYGSFNLVEAVLEDLDSAPKDHVNTLPYPIRRSLMYVALYEIPEGAEAAAKDAPRITSLHADSEKLYVVDNTNAYVTLATLPETLQYKTLSPYLCSSLAALAVNDMWLPEFDDFLPHLPGEPLNTEAFIQSVWAGRADYTRYQ